MLLSQQIIQRPKFLKEVIHSVEPIEILRGKIIGAIKLIVGHELLNYNQYASDWIKAAYCVNEPSPSLIDEKIKKYSQFAKTPFPKLFIENETGAILVEELDDGWRMTSILEDGKVSPIVMDCYPNQRSASGTVRLVMHYYRDDILRYYSEEALEARIEANAFILAQTFETLLFLNTKNVRVHTYKPTQKELENIPKVFRPKFDYKVLDIFREKEKYGSLKEITDHLCSGSIKEHDLRRAHMVRGHFKQKKNGLFWWNSFMRCRKNIGTAGYVDKDYRLVSK